MRYKCLVLDHDDTVVKSTPAIHYPAFVEAMRILRPNDEKFSLEEFIGYSFKPGFMELLRDIKCLNDEEIEIEQEIWRKFTKTAMPESYEGFDVLFKRYRERGGQIAVASHSESENILRHYQALFGFEPDLVFGWDRPEAERKPHPFPLEETMRALSLKPSELLMVDDLKPGMDMAQQCGVDFAWAGWSDTRSAVGSYMNENAQYAFDTVAAFEQFLLK